MLTVDFKLTLSICIDGFPTGSSGAPSAGVCISFTGADEASGAAGWREEVTGGLQQRERRALQFPRTITSIQTR